MDLNPPPFSRFTHEGLEIAFFDEGDPAGAPILLIHGFASSANVNWVFPGWLKTLGDAGYPLWGNSATQWCRIPGTGWVQRDWIVGRGLVNVTPPDFAGRGW